MLKGQVREAMLTEARRVMVNATKRPVVATS
jgi:hypothetical protein